MRKEELLIIDRDDVLAVDWMVAEQRRLRHQARRFVFGAEASAMAGTILRETELEVVRNRQFAIPPYETLYLEMNVTAFLRALDRKTSADTSDVEADDRVGFLLHRQRLLVMTTTEKGNCAMSLCHYRLDLPGQHLEGWEKAAPELARMDARGFDNSVIFRGALMLGSTLQQVERWDEISDAVASARAIFEPGSLEYARHCFGELRNWWLLMLLLNRPAAHVSVEQLPTRQVIVSGKRRPYLAHGVVTLHLRKGEPARRVVFGDRAPPRAHDVMGHFAHYHLREGCEHCWPVLPEVSEEGVLRWRCEGCGGLRVRRREHVRGSAGVGFRTKHYEVRP